MKKLSVFDVIGPKMIGPSSSHTAGALRIARIAKAFLPCPPQKAVFILYGSFAETFQGHGTDRALVGGILGYDTDDIRIRDSLTEASKQGIVCTFLPNRTDTQSHANTVGVELTGEGDKRITLLGVSLGGGEIEVREINGVEVAFRGEYPTLLVQHTDTPGVVAFLTKHLSENQINIAFMKLYRESKGDRAYTIIETDQAIPAGLLGTLEQHVGIDSVILLEGW